MRNTLLTRRACLKALSAACALAGAGRVLAQKAPALPANPKILIVYFSWAGSSETVAKEVARLTGGTLARIEKTEPYPSEYRKTTEVARLEREADSRPAIKPLPNVQDYDVIILGHAIWSGNMPMPVRTFLESQDFSGKIVAHWTTHGGSGLGESHELLKQELKDSNVLEGLAVYGWGGVRNLESVGAWLKKIGLLKN